MSQRDAAVLFMGRNRQDGAFGSEEWRLRQARESVADQQHVQNVRGPEDSFREARNPAGETTGTKTP
jgi:hypothetical protein